MKFFEDERINNLYTERLNMRMIKVEDINDYHELCCQKDVAENAGWSTHKSFDFSVKVLKYLISYNESVGVFLENKLIGIISLENTLNISGVYNLGFILNKKYWGNGYMFEALNKFLRFIFENNYAQKILCEHFVENFRSKKIIKRLKFKYKRNGHAMVESGKIKNTCKYFLTVEDFDFII